MAIKPVSEIAEIISGGTPKTSNQEYWGGNIPWLSVKDFNNGSKYVSNTEKTITRKGLEHSTTNLLQKNDIILSARGTVGAMAKISKPMAFNQSCFGIRAKSGLDQDFLYYALKNKITELTAFTQGSVFSTINRSSFDQWLLDIPSVRKQKSISHILSVLDAKIEINTQINDYLAEIALTLFNRECPQINEPNAMLSDIAQITMGQSPSGSSYNEDGNGEVFYQGRAEFGAFFPRRRLFTTEPKRMAQEGDTLMSVRAPVGDLNIANENCCIGRGLAAIHSESNQSFVHYLVRAQGRQLDTFNGDGTVFGSINGKALKELPVFLPSNDVIIHLESQLKSIDALIRRNDDESQVLEHMRDTLLPRLMSGEIDVSEVEVPTQLNNHLCDYL